MKNYIILAVLTFLVLGQELFAQSIRRSTLTSIGTSTTIGNLRVSSTFGQDCLGCRVLSNGSNYLRQGFQQPIGEDDDLQPCGFSSSIAVEPISTPCGTYYNFEYLGLADPAITEFSWDFGDGAAPRTSTEMNPQDIAYSVTGTQIISLSIVVPDSCSESVATAIDVTETAFAAHELSQDVLCFGNATGALELDIFGGTEPYAVKWSDAQTVERIRNDLVAGNYAYTLTDAENCLYENSIDILQPDTAILITKLDVLPETCMDTQDGLVEINVSGGTAPYTIVWSNGVTNESLIDNLITGPYTVEVIDGNNCTNSQGFEVGNICEQEGELIPDVITPNSDGFNDFWVIEWIDRFPDNTVEIYNRWGDLVWNRTNYLNEWDGTNNNGKDLLPAPYYYVLKIRNFDDQGNEKTIGGAVTIIR